MAKNKVGRPRKGSKVDFEAVRDLAIRGVEHADIVEHLGIHELVQVQEASVKVRETVRAGHAQFRIAIQKKLYSEGVLEGKISSLRTLAENWLDRYGDAAPKIDEAGIVEEIASIMQANAALHKKHHAEEPCHLAGCGTCRELHGN